jgi:hypothetical protein
MYEVLQDELNNCGDVSLCSCSYTLENGTAGGDEDLIIDFPNEGVTVM